LILTFVGVYLRLISCACHVRLDFADRIARQTRSGMAGISMSRTPDGASRSGWGGFSLSRPPSGASASTMALIVAAGAPIAPASPQPLTPSGLWVQGVSRGPTLNEGTSSGPGL